MGVEAAGDAGDQGAERERKQLGSRQVDAHRLGGDVIFMDGNHGAAEPDVPDAPHHQQRDGGHDHDLPQLRERADAAHSRRAAGRLEIAEEHADDLAETKRQDHDVDAADPQRRRSDDEARDRSRAAARGKRDANGTSALVSSAQT